MKIDFTFFRQGDRPEYGFMFEMPAVPQPGDKIIVRRPETAEEIYPEETAIVKRTEWSLKVPASYDPSSSREQ
jgi:hypothetical protein